MAIKISELTETQRNLETDFVEVSRDNGNGTFSSFKSKIGDGYMLGEIRYFLENPGSDWLKLDGSLLDEVAYPDLANSDFVNVINPGDYVSHTKTVSNVQVFTEASMLDIKDIRYVQSTDEILFIPSFYILGNAQYENIRIFDCATGSVRYLTVTVDGAALVDNLKFISTTDEYNGNTYGIYEYQTQLKLFKVTGGIAGKTGNVNLETVADSPSLNNDQNQNDLNLVASTADGVIILSEDQTKEVFVSTDSGITFDTVNAEDISKNLGSGGLIGEVQIQSGYLFLAGFSISTSEFVFIKITDLIALAENGPASQYTNKGIYISCAPFNQSEASSYSYIGKMVSPTGSVVTKTSPQKISILEDFAGSLINTKNFFDANMPEEPSGVYPVGNGFAFTIDEQNTNVKVFYADYNQGVITIDLDASPLTTTNDPVGLCLFSDVSNKLFVFYNDEASGYFGNDIGSYNEYDITLSSTLQKFLPLYPKKGGTFAYVKAVV